MGKFEVSVARTTCSRPKRRPQLCRRESRQAHVSKRWELLSVNTHIVSCIPVDRGRRYRDRARIDIDTTASLQTTSNCEFPIGAMGKIQIFTARTSCSGPERQPQLCKRESRQARQPFPQAMGIYEDERAHRLCWSRSGSSQLTLCLPRL